MNHVETTRRFCFIVPLLAVVACATTAPHSAPKGVALYPETAQPHSEVAVLRFLIPPQHLELVSAQGAHVVAPASDGPFLVLPGEYEIRYSVSEDGLSPGPSAWSVRAHLSANHQYVGVIGEKADKTVVFMLGESPGGALFNGTRLEHDNKSPVGSPETLRGDR